MQVIGRKQPAILVQVVDGGLKRLAGWPHIGLFGQHIAFGQIAAGTGRNNVLPDRCAALGAWNYMIEGQVIMRAAILAGEPVTQKHVKAGKGRMSGGFDIGFERNHRGQLHFPIRAADGFFVILNNIDPIQKYGLDCILPAPEGQGIIAQGSKIRIQNQRRAGLGRNVLLEVNRQFGASSCSPEIVNLTEQPVISHHSL
jgi:hypothetical protein